MVVVVAGRLMRGRTLREVCAYRLCGGMTLLCWLGRRAQRWVDENLYPDHFQGPPEVRLLEGVEGPALPPRDSQEEEDKGRGRR